MEKQEPLYMVSSNADAMENRMSVLPEIKNGLAI